MLTSLLDDPWLNKVLLQPSRGQNTIRELNKEEKRLGFRWEGLEAENDTLGHELMSLNMGDTLKLWVWAAAECHIMNILSSRHGKHPIYAFFIWGATPWHPSCHLVAYNFPQNRTFDSFIPSTDPIWKLGVTRQDAHPYWGCRTWWNIIFGR